MRSFHESLHEESSLFINHLLCLRCIPAAGVPAYPHAWPPILNRMGGFFCLQKT